MIVMNSLFLLEQLTEIEKRIKEIEGVIMELGIEEEKDVLRDLLIACQSKTGRQDK